MSHFLRWCSKILDAGSVVCIYLESREGKLNHRCPLSIRPLRSAMDNNAERESHMARNFNSEAIL